MLKYWKTQRYNQGLVSSLRIHILSWVVPERFRCTLCSPASASDAVGDWGTMSTVRALSACSTRSDTSDASDASAVMSKFQLSRVEVINHVMQISNTQSMFNKLPIWSESRQAIKASRQVGQVGTQQHLYVSPPSPQP